MSEQTGGIIGTLVSLPIFQAEWVLWLLLALSVASLAVMVERFIFYKRHTIDVDGVRKELTELMSRGDINAAAELLGRYDTLETNVALFGLRDHADGPDAVQDLIAGAARKEKARYEKRLGFLAIIASNAPFIGLFGTVLGIIRAFQDLSSTNMAEASDAVMAGIAEALVATAVGLLVAIPAVIAYNMFKTRVKGFADNMHLLSSVIVAKLKAADARAPQAWEGA